MMSPQSADLIRALQSYASDNDAVQLSRFFKTGPGQYGEGDVFIGVRVPDNRKVCKEFYALPPTELSKLFASPVHEHRLSATIILCAQFKKASRHDQKQLYDMYLKALDDGHINNWDIIDTSCEHIIGAYARDVDEAILFELAHSGKLWHQRAAIVSCFAWLRKGDIGPTVELAEILWPEKHDLLQKAVGWMLREAGKRVDENFLINFLDDHAREMPRTQLRYAIERLSMNQKRHYMSMARNIL